LRSCAVFSLWALRRSFNSRSMVRLILGSSITTTTSLLWYASSHEPTPHRLPLPSVEGCGCDHQYPQQGSQSPLLSPEGCGRLIVARRKILGTRNTRGDPGSGSPRWCVTEIGHDIFRGPFSLIFPPQTNKTQPVSLKRQVAAKTKTATTTAAETITMGTTTTMVQPPRPYPTPTVQRKDE